MKTFLNLLKVVSAFLSLWSLCIGWSYLLIGIFSAKMNVYYWGRDEYISWGLLILFYAGAIIGIMTHASGVSKFFNEV